MQVMWKPTSENRFGELSIKKADRLGECAENGRRERQRRIVGIEKLGGRERIRKIQVRKRRSRNMDDGRPDTDDRRDVFDAGGKCALYLLPITWPG